MQAGQFTRVIFVWALVWWPSAQAGESVPARSDVPMSPGVQTLFRQEMVELLAATQRIAAALPLANWKEIAATSAAIRHSYVLEKKLTREQQDELARLPGEFQALDEAFHSRAAKLEHAASEQDAESVAFQFSRLLEACTTCHTQFAKTRFPGFAAANTKDQRHAGGR